MVEGRKSHLYVSKMVAKATNQEVKYTLTKGGDDEECRKWVIKALKDHGVLTRKQINELLWGKLPIDFDDSQKRTKVGNILTKMRKHGIVYVDDLRNWRLKRG